MPDLTAEERRTVLQHAMDARSISYSPYSKFRVGSAILLNDGQIFKGANVENASYGGCICAERTALLTAHTTLSTTSPGKTLSGQIKAIAVSSDLKSEPCSPCGICRQFIREFANLDTPILMVWQEWKSQESKEDQNSPRGKNCHDDHGVVVRTLEELLPLSFGPDQLIR